ncbi:MAG: hypothetical protein JXN63_09420 [Candidatus Delongbacteria bacterium]|nr:hypothetical protein [Candidatus Delongbacteria bacterium]
MIWNLDDDILLMLYIYFMTTTLSIRELTRSSKILLDYDYIDIEDRKSHTYKGVFIPEKYADEVKSFLEDKIRKEKSDQKNKLMKFAGCAEGDFGDKSIQELISEKGDEYT